MAQKIKKYIKFVSSIMVVMASLMLTSCGKKENSPLSVPEGTQASELMCMEPCTNKTDKVEYAIDCEMLAELENQRNSESWLITLPVTQGNASTDNSGKPFFWIMGESGSTNLGFSYSDTFLLDVQILHDTDLCAGDATCDARPDNLAEAIRNITRSMARGSLFLRIDLGKASFMTHIIFWNRGKAALDFDIFASVEEGYPSGVALLSLMYDMVIPFDLTWGELVVRWVSTDFDPYRDYLTEMSPVDSIFIDWRCVAHHSCHKEA